MKLRAIQQNIQHQVLSQALQQSLHILQMPILELRALLEAELVSNPVLEEGPEIAGTQGDRLDQLVRAAHPEVDRANLWESAGDDDDESSDPLATVAQPPPTLDDFLLRQVAGMELTAEELKAAEVIIGVLDDRGYLRDPLEAIAGQAGLPVATVEKALQAVQQCEPSGIGARDLAECLLLQLKAQDLQDSLAARIIREGFLGAVGERQYVRVARRLGCGPEAVEQAARAIASLAPSPGELVSPGDSTPSIVPDLVITKHGEGFHIQLRDDELPPVRISSSYRRMLDNPGISDEVRTFVRDRVQAALTVLRGIQQRQRTMRRLAEAIVASQPEFLEHGLGALRPMTHKQMAALIGRHPSTVARAVADKYLECPAGVFAVSDLFSASLPSDAGEAVSAQSIRVQLRELVAAEDRRRPLNDAAIAAQLRGLGIHLARRTVAKYRRQLRIPAAHQRRVKSS